MAFNRWLLAGLKPERAREILGMRWSRTDQLVLRILATTVKRVWPLLPERVRYLPRAYENITRARRQPALYSAASANN